jgi:hypothetical protein
MTAARLTWPEGKRLAVLVGVLLESWSDGKSPTYFTRTTPLKPGTVDRAGIQWSEFGGKEGVWRILQVLRAARLPATFFCNALSAETYPEAIKGIVAGGHEVAAHGWSQDQYLLDMPPEQQLATIRKCLDVLQKHSGRRPDGWVSSVYSWNEHTVDALIKAGIRWHADALDTTFPRREKTDSGTIVALPWCDFVDNRVLRSSPNDYFDVYKGMVDFQRQHESAGLIHIAVHCHFGGRPLMSAAFERVLDYMRGFPDVWFPRHRELVRWFVEQQMEMPAAERLAT